MGFPVYSLRTGILAQLAFLIVAAMLLINVVMVKSSERDLINSRIQTGRILIQSLEQNLGFLVSPGDRILEAAVSSNRFRKNAARLSGITGFSDMRIVDTFGTPVFSVGTQGGPERPDLALARDALKTGAITTNFRGTTWGVLWLNRKEVVIAAPLLFEGRPLGGVSVRASLMPIYETLRRSQKLVFLYILMDTLILSLVGIFLLSRIVVKPIHKLLKMTEEYKGGDMIPPFAEAGRNEIGELSRSLNIMVKRLEENKVELKEHIASLERANKELQQAQNEIIRSEKMASVGRLAAGIAHEIGNPIGIILGYLELLTKGDITDEEKGDFLSRIESEITRINETIRELLDFSRPGGGMPEETRAHDILNNTLSILNPQPMMEDIQLLVQLSASRDTVLADPNQLQQVFLNIIMNAADALSEKQGGAEEKVLEITSRNDGDSIEVTFEDNGPGIREEDILRIFDPFYTTKEPGKGTGLGLSVCYRIVEGLGGTLKAESVPGGGGTTLRVSIPLLGEVKGE